jgi:hypothetical protein
VGAATCFKQAGIDAVSVSEDDETELAAMERDVGRSVGYGSVQLGRRSRSALVVL